LIPNEINPALIITSTIPAEWTRDAERPPLLPRWSVGASAGPLVGLMINAINPYAVIEAKLAEDDGT